MSEIILWSLLAFFGAFGLVEFLRFVYTDWNGGCNDYHVVVSTRNKEDGIESVVRNTIMATASSSVIIIDDGTNSETGLILEKLKERYSYIRVLTFDEYIEFLQSKEC